MTATPDPDRGNSLFRREALEHHLASRGEGHVLRIAPRWTDLAYPVLLVMVGLGLIYAIVGRIHEYASGPAVIEVANATDVTSLVAGTVTAVEVDPGQSVERGKVLIRLNDTVERADYDRIQGEFEMQLINRLRDRTDEAAGRALMSLRSQRDLARARLEERIIRAPAAGIVNDVRVREGQVLMPGQSVLGMVEGTARLEVVALLPGHYRPLLRPGMRLRLELIGYAYAYQELTITRVADEAVGPSVAERYLRPKMAEAVSVTGPVVLVWATLDRATFVADGKEHAYFDGQIAVAEARVQSESIIVSLIPGLEALLERHHG